MSSNGGPKVAVKLFIDRKKKRVLFAESHKDFVDILFSFLTLPLGIIVHRLGKQSQIGCLDELYKSVENLSEDHFQTKPCKTMLLRPANAAAVHCDRLKIKVDDTDQTSIYVCLNSSCSKRYFSAVRDASCKCGSITNGIIKQPDRSLVAVGTEETADGIISLLRRAILSKEPLTGLYFDVAIVPNATIFSQIPGNLLMKQEAEAEPKFKPIKIRLVQTKDDSSVLYAEVGQDFVDIFFGLLCIPVGSICKTYSQFSPNGCIDNIYKSANDGGCVKQECRSLLLSPKLPPFFGCSSNVVEVEELLPRVRIYLSHTYELNPKAPRDESDTSRRIYINGSSVSEKKYVSGGSMNFMVTNDLRIVDFSLAKSLQAIRASKIPKGKLVEKELTLDKTQVLKLLRAAMVTRDALSSALLPPEKHVTRVAMTSTQATSASGFGLQAKDPPQLRRSSRVRKPLQPGE
ncbi:unnamed protein product [Alopecurus aequalis]